MFYRTLHSYILRELLRIFLLTASTLTTLLAFGGMFRPLTKQGIDVSQVMVLMINLMPAMLAYAIPIAALFAAVLVYWRMSTDNELTACRAGGVSFVAIVMPAFILGMVVASMDLVFVNYVVPRFLQSTERAVRSDLSSWIVNQISRTEKFQYDALPLVVSADSAELQTTSDPDVSRVILHRMAAVVTDRGRAQAIAIAQEAQIEIHNLPAEDAAEMSFRLINGTIFDPTNGFRKATATFDSGLLNGKPFRLPSLFKSKPKYLNWKDLIDLNDDAYRFGPVAETIDKIDMSRHYQVIETNIQAAFDARVKAGATAVEFDGVGMAGGPRETVKIYASHSAINATAGARESLSFTSKDGGKFKVEMLTAGNVMQTYTADSADMVLLIDDLTTRNVTAQLRLTAQPPNHVTRELNDKKMRPTEVDGATFIPIALDPALTVVAEIPGGKYELVKYAAASKNKGLNKLSNTAAESITKLYQTIYSELHSRGSFSLSCLTLVMLGAALGILMRGKNPLAVFVVGFVPAIVLVLLITAGRQLTEGNPKNVTAGIIMIWAGNGILLLLVAGVYAKLLRR